MKHRIWDIEANKFIEVDSLKRTIAIRRKVRSGYVCFAVIDLNKHNEIPNKLLDKLVHHWRIIDNPDPKVVISTSDYEVYCNNVSGVDELLISLEYTKSKTHDKDAILRLRFLWEDPIYSNHKDKAYDCDSIRLDRIGCRELYKVLMDLH